MKTQNIIEVTDVVKVFRVKTQDVEVLKTINLEIKEGDFTIIFGPSGCGKSTLLHVILGLEEPTSGDLTFFSRHLYHFSEDERSEFRKQNIGMIYQQPNWIKSLSVIENVAFAATVSGIGKNEAAARAKKMLELVGMANWADYYPTELSSGQQQKVSLARALITEPKVIIADEPTGNLDHKSGIDLMNLFQQLVKQGKTVIMVTHDINNIDYASTVIQFFDGRIVKIHQISASSPAQVKKEITQGVSQTPSGPTVHKTRISTIDPQPQKDTRLHLGLHRFRRGLSIFLSNLSQVFVFLSLLLSYLFQQLFFNLASLRFLPKGLSSRLHLCGDWLANHLFPIFQRKTVGGVSRLDLIDLSIKNMKAKKTRTSITIGGMAIGISLIVFLVSVGYGLEKLVISRVARLDEMKQIDVASAVASNVKIDDSSLASFKGIPDVAKILPVIGVVGKINFQNSVTDIVVYGVLADYLKESAIKTVNGEIFTSNELVSHLPSSPDSSGSVAGVTDTAVPANYLDEFGQINFTINPDAYLRVRQSPDSSSTLLGYTRRVEGIQDGTELLGRGYLSDNGAGDIVTDSSGRKLGLWVKSHLPLWQKCLSFDPDCPVSGYRPLLDESGFQTQEDGYLAEIDLRVDRGFLSGDVLGETDIASSSALANFVDISAIEATPSTENLPVKVTLPQQDRRETVINRSLSKILGFKDPSEAVGKKINLSLVATGELTTDNQKISSEPVEYSIIGVTADSRTPVAFLPLIDVKQLGISRYSQVKIVTSSQSTLVKIRKQVEALGFRTTSVVDTVAQIEQLFSTLQFILGLLGVVALSVAALGMFNTLTVSLLERTREVGMMKAIGMKSLEVRDLFLTESMIMGIYGGIGGLSLGYLVGKIFSLILSGIAITRGVGVIDVVYIPPLFIILIVTLSTLVGILTGIYPSYRATKISALNALRYE